VIRLASLNPALPQEVIMAIGAATHALRSNRLHPFQGPVEDREGRTVVAAGTVLDDERLKSMHFFVKGVIGILPK
jgi:basic membrane protein A